jgi:hypothetical protein
MSTHSGACHPAALHSTVAWMNRYRLLCTEPLLGTSTHLKQHAHTAQQNTQWSDWPISVAMHAGYLDSDGSEVRPVRKRAGYHMANVAFGQNTAMITTGSTPHPTYTSHTYFPHTPTRQESGVEPVTIAKSIAPQPSTQVLTHTHTHTHTQTTRHTHPHTRTHTHTHAHTHTHTHPQTHHSPQQTKRGVDMRMEVSRGIMNMRHAFW